MENRTYRFYFRSPDLDFQTEDNSTSDALAIALEHTGCAVDTLVEIEQPDPDDPYNPDAFIALRGAALDIWLDC